LLCIYAYTYAVMMRFSERSWELDFFCWCCRLSREKRPKPSFSHGPLLTTLLFILIASHIVRQAMPYRLQCTGSLPAYFMPFGSYLLLTTIPPSQKNWETDVFPIITPLLFWCYLLCDDMIMYLCKNVSMTIFPPWTNYLLLL